MRYSIICLVILLNVASAYSQNLDPMTVDGKDWRLEGAAEWALKDNSMTIIKNTITDTPYRVPSARAIYLGKKYGNVEISARVKCNAVPEQIRGDIIIIFGYQSPEEFYYAHFTGTVDDTHNGVFIVNKSDRRKLEDNNQVPFLPDRDWHRIKVARNIKTGEIKMFVDDMQKPALVLTDKTFKKGSVGFGSFNDPGEITDITIGAGVR